MTKKDYIAIASQFRSAKITTKISDKKDLYIPYLDAIILGFCEMLKNDNSRFNKNKFISFINDGIK